MSNWKTVLQGRKKPEKNTVNKTVYFVHSHATRASGRKSKWQLLRATTENFLAALAKKAQKEK
jgi:imidazoleglycerol phosphate synthase glutamine amidotransferase subunit HisH